LVSTTLEKAGMEGNSDTGIPDWLVSILVCPQDKGKKLELVSIGRLSRLNERISSGKVKDRGGKVVDMRMDEALVREDGKVLYLVRDGIPDLIVDDGIDLEPGDIE